MTDVQNFEVGTTVAPPNIEFLNDVRDGTRSSKSLELLCKYVFVDFKSTT
jgi:hypothetical protein